MAKRNLAPLVDILQRQASFASSYSPLYFNLFDYTANWLQSNDTSRNQHESLKDWLCSFQAARTPLEISLLLVASVHRDVLLEAPGTQDLAAYYPSAGGTQALPTLETERVHLGELFLQTVANRRDFLEPMIQHATVQTNETARGLFWMLPVALMGWKQIHLVDLGASAGLNLVADRRSFTLIADGTADDDNTCSLGPVGLDSQFTTVCKPTMPNVLSSKHFSPPEILSRQGCDLNPFPLETAVEKATLKSFVWPDQTRRFHRLEEGLEAIAKVRQRQTIPIHKVHLPDELLGFLDSLELLPAEAPVVIYNTYMTAYLDNVMSLDETIKQWAQANSRNVLWAQAEPPRYGIYASDHLPEHECAWTVDLFAYGNDNSVASILQQKHTQWHLAWAHPHCTQVEWIPGQLVDYYESCRSAVDHPGQ